MRIGSKLVRVMTSSVLINTAVLTGSSVVILENSDTMSNVFVELFEKEGRGDNVTSVATGNIGVTGGAVRATTGTDAQTDEDVAVQYLNVLNSLWERYRGYREAPTEVKEALLDLSYNVGEGVFSWKGLLSAVERGDYLEAMRQTLDTANVNKQSLKGLAIRRAAGYNRVAEDDIFWIKQEEDGTIKYATFDTLIMSYKPRGGKHEKSVADTVVVKRDPRGVF